MSDIPLEDIDFWKGVAGANMKLRDELKARVAALEEAGRDVAKYLPPEVNERFRAVLNAGGTPGLEPRSPASERLEPPSSRRGEPAPGVLIVEPDEFDRIVADLQNPSPPTESIRRGAELLRQLYPKEVIPNAPARIDAQPRPAQSPAGAEILAQAMIRRMFAPHELPVSDELQERYRDAAREAIAEFNSEQSRSGAIVPEIRCDSCDNGVEREWGWCAWCGTTSN